MCFPAMSGLLQPQQLGGAGIHGAVHQPHTCRPPSGKPGRRVSHIFFVVWVTYHKADVLYLAVGLGKTPTGSTDQRASCVDLYVYDGPSEHIFLVNN